MVKSRYKKHTKLESNNTVATIISCAIIVAILGGAGMLAVNSLMVQETGNEDWAADWVDKNVTARYENRMRVNFEPITTPNSAYELMKKSSAQIMARGGSDFESKNIVIDTTVRERTYVDRIYNVSIEDAGEKVISTDKFIEAGPVYFQDMLLTRYVNDSGILTMNMLAIIHTESQGVYGDTDTAVIEIKDAELHKYTTNLNVEEKIETTNINALTESEYLRNISELILRMYTVNGQKEMKRTREDAKKYFSFEGRQTVFDGKTALQLKPDTEVSVVFIKTGSSQQEPLVKDRVFLRLEIEQEDKLIKVDVILRINTQGFIFDVDIL